MVGKILSREPGAAGAERRYHVGGGLLVERARPALSDRLHGFGKRRKPHDVAWAGRFAVDQEMARCAGIGSECAGRKPPVMSDARGDRKAVLGMMDRRGECAIEPETAMAFEDCGPRLEGAGHRDRMHGRKTDGALALLPQRLGARRRGSPAGAVIAPDRRAGLCNEAETIAADPGHVRLDDAEKRHCRDRRIGGGAARPEHRNRGFARQRMGRCRHAVAGKNGRAPRAMEIAEHCGLAAGPGGGVQLAWASSASPEGAPRWALRMPVANPPVTSTKLMRSRRKNVVAAASFTSTNSAIMPTNNSVDRIWSTMLRPPRPALTISTARIRIEPATMMSSAVSPHSPSDFMRKCAISSVQTKPGIRKTRML